MSISLSESRAHPDRLDDRLLQVRVRFGRVELAQLAGGAHHSQIANRFPPQIRVLLALGPLSADARRRANSSCCAAPRAARDVAVGCINVGQNLLAALRAERAQIAHRAQLQVRIRAALGILRHDVARLIAAVLRQHEQRPAA